MSILTLVMLSMMINRFSTQGEIKNKIKVLSNVF